MIEFDNISLSYGEKSVLRNFSRRISPGRKVAIIGPSGSGKTTLLKMVPGFVRPTSGRVLVAGIIVGPETIRNIRLSLTFVPQSFDAPGNVAEALETPFRFKANRASRPDAAKIEIMFRNLALDPGQSFRERMVAELSSGERLRLSIAVALLLERPILLMDEPTANLDAESRRKTIDCIIGEKARTLIVVTHDREFMDACDERIDLDA